jgi:hypothetical protein
MSRRSLLVNPKIAEKQHSVAYIILKRSKGSKVSENRKWRMETRITRWTMRRSIKILNVNRKEFTK